MAGARGPLSVVDGVEALRGELWGAIAAGLENPSRAEVLRLSEGIARLCDELASALLGAAEAPSPTPGRDRGTVEAVEREAAPERERAESAPRGVLRAGAAAGAGGSAQAPAAPAPPGAAHGLREIERRMQRFERDRVPFAVLLAQAEGADRGGEAVRVLPPPAMVEEICRRAWSSIAGARGEEVAAVAAPRWEGAVVEERPGRYVLIFPGAGQPAGRALAVYIQEALSAPMEGDGERARVLVGVAVCPEDGRTAGALAAHAEVDLYAARAAIR